MYKESKIYVAGHSGLLGTALVKRLNADGYLNIITSDHADLDLCDKSRVDNFFYENRPEYVFLAAGKVGGIESNRTRPADYLHVNLAIQDNIFEAAVKCDVKNLVFYGSTCTYPKNCPQPMKEDDWMTGALEPTSEAYAAAKIAGMIACRSYNNQFKNNRFIALVPATMFGPGDNFDLQNSHVMSALMRRISEAAEEKKDRVVLWGSGSPRREFIYSDDVAEASIFAIENSGKLVNRHYNVGVGHDVSIRELAEIIGEITGYKGEICWDNSRPDGTKEKMLDSTKFSKLGWNPKVSFNDALKSTYNWYQSLL